MDPNLRFRKASPGRSGGSSGEDMEQASAMLPHASAVATTTNDNMPSTTTITAKRVAALMFILVMATGLALYWNDAKNSPSPPPIFSTPPSSSLPPADDDNVKVDPHFSPVLTMTKSTPSADDMLKLSTKYLQDQTFDEASQKPINRLETHIILDKPIYRPGEALRGSLFLFDALTLIPVPVSTGTTLSVSFTVKDPKDVEVMSIQALFPDQFSSSGKEEASNTASMVGGVSWNVPATAASGEYTLELSDAWAFTSNAKTQMSFVPVRIKFQVRATNVAPKIRKALVFDKDSYAASDTVKVTLDVSTFSYTDLTRVTFSARVDGAVVFDKTFVSPFDKTPSVTFKLPNVIVRGEGVMSAMVSVGVISESVTKTIPIVLQRLDLGVYPEGGVLVCGNGGNDNVPRQRVYVEALHSITGDAASFEADFFDLAQGKSPIGHVTSTHEGRGVSTPLRVQSHQIVMRIVSPPSVAGQETTVRTSCNGKQQPSPVVMSFASSSAIFAFTDPIQFDLWWPTSSNQKYRVAVYKKEMMMNVNDMIVVTKPGKVSIPLLANKGAVGVLRVTVFAGNLPVAERLIYRRPAHVLEIEVESEVKDVADANGGPAAADDTIRFIGDQTRNHRIHAQPSDGIQVRLRTWLRDLDLNGKMTGPRTPVSATIALRVTDAALSSTMEKRLLPPRLPIAVMLDTQVNRLNDAHMFANPVIVAPWGWHDETPPLVSTDVALDLLLGTQGWRRFAYYDMQGFFTEGSSPVDGETWFPIAAAHDPKKSPSVASSSTSSCSVYQRTRLFGFGKRGQNHMPVMAAFQHGNHPKLLNFARQQENPVMFMAAPMAHAPPPPLDMAGAGEPEKNDMMNAGDGEEGEMAAAIGAAEDVDANAADRIVAAAPRLAVPKFAARMAPPRPINSFVRVFAHPQRKYTKAELEAGPVRSDFAETVYHNPSLVTKCDNKQCVARVSFGLNDAASTTFVIHSDGVAGTTLGASNAFISVVAPLEVDVTLPYSMVVGDSALVPVTVSDGEGKANVMVSQTTSGILTLPQRTTQIFSSGKMLLPIKATRAAPQGVNVTLKASRGIFKDAITRTTIVAPRGFPAHRDVSGMLAPTPVSFDITLPSDMVVDSLNVDIKIYTSPVGRLTQAIEALIHEPCGCFEQVSSTTYPLVFALQYLNTHSDANPQTIARAKRMLSDGYKKLVSYESPGGGFEWFGQAPGHEALTAYGVLQFMAMSQADTGMPGMVDETMLTRTIKWLNVQRRDGKGGFLRSEKSLDSFGGAPTSTTNAYITWSLVRAGILKRRDDDVIKSLVDSVSDATSESGRDPYLVALAALTLYDVTTNEKQGRVQAKALGLRLVDMQTDSGAVIKGAKDTITRSQGQALEIETTALALLVFLHDDATFGARARMAVDYIASTCQNGRFASTQATALSLMAIVEYDKKFSKPVPAGFVDLYIDGVVVDTRALVSSSSRDSSHKCSDGKIWNDCASACEATCEHRQPVCTMNCVAKCACPDNVPYWDTSAMACLSAEQCDDPLAVAARGPNDQGVIHFSPTRVLAAWRKSSSNNSKKSSLVDPISGKVTNVQLKMRMMTVDEKDVSLPFSCHASFAVLQRASESKDVNVAVKLETDDLHVRVGDIATIRAQIQNIAKDDVGKSKSVPMVVAIIGIPAGFEVRFDQLQELKKSRIVDFVEYRPDSGVVLYWRTLPAGGKVDVPIQVIASIAGEYTSPASRVYLFYSDEFKTWADGIQVTIEGSDDDHNVVGVWEEKKSGL